MIALAPTDLDWFTQLRTRQASRLVNFWTPTPWNVRGLKAGDLLYFLLKAPYRKLGGFGQFVAYENMNASEAWKRFGADNGVSSLAELVSRTQKYVARRTDRDVRRSDIEIGCILLSSPVFFGEDQLVAPEDVGLTFPRQVVKIKYFRSLASIPGLADATVAATITSVEDVASATAGRGGQGFITDPALRTAIEQRAMTLAKEHYGKLFTSVRDTSAMQPYDLECSPPQMRVEVKGSTSEASEIRVTAGEVEHARGKTCRTDLFIVSSISISHTQLGPEAHGGQIRVIQDWLPASADLKPLLFTYRVPQ